MDMTEVKPGHMGLMEAGHEEDQKVVVPVVAQQGVEGAEQQQQPQRGLKRTRRERGSSAKERVSKMPPCAAGKRSSIYRGVTRHRWTGRYEAHLWDKSTWNQSQNKKGKQVYLGAYDEEEAAARAYDLAALKYWGPGTLINFPLADYARDTEEMQNVTREEYLASLRRKSSGFSRGVSKYRGVARHHHNGRWEARIGRVFGNKYLYLGTYSTQEEAAAAYDMAAIEYRGLNAVTNFDLSRYIRWLRPGQSNSLFQETDATLSPNAPMAGGDDFQLTGLTEDHLQHGGQQEEHQHNSVWGVKSNGSEPYQSLPSLGLGSSSAAQQRSSSSPTALSLLLQSSMFKQMLERASASAPTESEIESCISSSYPSSESSLGVEQQQQQQQHVHQSQLQHSQQPQQDNNGYYSSWGKQATHQQNLLQAPLDLQDPIENIDGSVHHGHENSYQQRFRQQFMTSSQHVHNIMTHQYSDCQDQIHQKTQQNYHATELHHRQQLHQPDELTAVYGRGYTHGSAVSNLYSDQDSGGSTIDDSTWAFTNLLPLSSGTITA